MKLLSYVTFAVLILAPARLWAADPCEALNPPRPDFNRWLMSVNIGNGSSKAELLEAMDLLSQGGIQVGSIFRFRGNPEVVFAVRFRPDYFSDIDQARRVKSEFLQDWQDLEASSLECDGPVTSL